MNSAEKPAGAAYLIRAHVLHRIDVNKVEMMVGDEIINPLQGGLEVSKVFEQPRISFGG